jgi:NADH:ubiquinone oxidoreductase subunit 3 (subunit A)
VSTVALLALLALVAAGFLGLLLVHRLLAVSEDTLAVLPLASGRVPEQHALSRYHPRWYAASVVFLAFDVEMLFMYPWAVVVADLGVGAVVEMFVFLGVLLAAVAWARREGAFRWA